MFQRVGVTNKVVCDNFQNLYLPLPLPLIPLQSRRVYQRVKFQYFFESLVPWCSQHCPAPCRVRRRPCQRVQSTHIHSVLSGERNASSIINILPTWQEGPVDLLHDSGWQHADYLAVVLVLYAVNSTACAKLCCLFCSTPRPPHTYGTSAL